MYKWERRELKENSKKRFVSDNRNSVRLIGMLSINGEAKKTKSQKKRKFR